MSIYVTGHQNSTLYNELLFNIFKSPSDTRNTTTLGTPIFHSVILHVDYASFFAKSLRLLIKLSNLKKYEIWMINQISSVFYYNLDHQIFSYCNHNPNLVFFSFRPKNNGTMTYLPVANKRLL